MNNSKQKNSGKIEVLLVDDHAMLRKGMALLLGTAGDILIIGEAQNGEEAVTQTRLLEPDIVVMDITMPELNGIEATRQIIKESPNSKIIALSIHSAKSFVDDMLNAGASGYLLKESAPEELIHGIRAVMNGDMYLSSAITETVVSAYMEGIPKDKNDKLTEVNIDILQTKLHKYPLVSDLIPRPRLIEQLASQKTRPLTLISAPAGFGKSTLVSSWLETCDCPNAWFSLEPDDSNLRQFLSYFITAVQNIFPSSCEQTLSLSKALQLPPLSILSSTFSNELNELDVLDQPFFMVLDNYQHIDKQSPVNELLSYLLERPPLPLHLVIITRRDPPLQLLALRAKSQMTELRMRDLSFTRDETKLLLEKKVVLTASEEALENLHLEIEGWVVGLRLVAEALRSCEDQESFLLNLSGGIQQTQKYLLQEVIARQAPQILDCLLKTSILDRFCESLCKAVVCPPKSRIEVKHFNAVKFIGELTEGNLFALPLDSKDKWFRFHNFFQHLLQQELKKQKTSKEVFELHMSASQWFEAKGLIDEAIKHAIAADNKVAAADIIERQRDDMLNEDRFSQLEKWLSLIPTDIKQQRIALLLTEAWVAYFSLHLDRVSLLVSMIKSLDKSEPISSPYVAELNIFRSILSYWVGNGKDSMKYAITALKELPFKQSMMTGEAEFFNALASHMIGDKEIAIKRLDNKLRRVEYPRYAFRSRLYAARLIVHLLSGELMLTLHEAQRLTATAQRWKGDYATTWGYYFQAVAQFHTFRLDEAIKSFMQVKKRMYLFERRAAIDCMAGITLTYQLMGKPEHAKEAASEMMAVAHELGGTETIAVAESARARLTLLQGNSLPAIYNNKLLDKDIQVQELLYWIENPMITQVRIDLATGTKQSLVKAQQTLLDLLPQLKSVHFTNQLIEVLTLKCLVHKKQGQSNEAMETLHELLIITEQGGWVRPFIELGQPIEKMLKSYTDQESFTDFLYFLLEAFSQNSAQQKENALVKKSESFDTWKVELLTNREIDILELLAKRLQNKEIAEKLFVSTETVKTHLKNLYQKLNVHSRREATAKASGILNEQTNSAKSNSKRLKKKNR